MQDEDVSECVLNVRRLMKNKKTESNRERERERNVYIYIHTI